jgi:hypothetical protein
MFRGELPSHSFGSCHCGRRLRRSCQGSALRLSGGGLELAHQQSDTEKEWQKSKVMDPRFNVARILRHPAVQAKFDCILIDCPPSFSMTSQAAAIAATHYYVPAQLDGFGITQVRLTLKHHSDLARQLRIGPMLAGVVNIGLKEAALGDIPKPIANIPWVHLRDGDQLAYLYDAGAKSAFDALSSELLRACTSTDQS